MTQPLAPALDVRIARRDRDDAPSSLDELAPSWDGLAVGSGSPMHHYAWVSACVETFLARADLRTVVVRGSGGPAAIAPLVVRPGVVPRLELLGPRHLHEPMDLVYKDAADAAELVRAIARLGLPLFLPRVPAESPTPSAVKSAWPRFGVVVCRPALGCPSLELDRRWTDPEPPIDAGRRSDFRRARRHAAKIGPVTCQIVSPTPATLEGALGDLFAVEAASWKGRDGTALASDPVQGAFYRRYAAAAARMGILRLCFLRIGERIAAVQFAIESEERFWLLKIGYDETFAKCSPGMLLIADTARDAAMRGLRSYEFLGTPEPWIRIWTEQVRPCVAVRAYPARPAGAAALTVDLAEAGWRKLLHALPTAR